MFQFKDRQYRAHRVSYISYCGDIPDGLLVCHKCDNPQCTNPSHLFLGTGKDNSQDRASKGRGTVGENHHNAKLTESEVVEIRQMVSQGVKTKDIVAKFGISYGMVGLIARGRNWQRAGGPLVVKIRTKGNKKS